MKKVAVLALESFWKDFVADVFKRIENIRSYLCGSINWQKSFLFRFVIQFFERNLFVIDVVFVADNDCRDFLGGRLSYIFNPVINWVECRAIGKVDNYKGAVSTCIEFFPEGSHRLNLSGNIPDNKMNLGTLFYNNRFLIDVYTDWRNIILAKGVFYEFLD